MYHWCHLPGNSSYRYTYGVPGFNWLQVSKLRVVHGLQCLCDGQSRSNKWLDSWSKLPGEMANIQFKVWLCHSLNARVGWVSQGLVWSFWKGNLLVCQTFKSNQTLWTSPSNKDVSAHLRARHVSTPNRRHKRLNANQHGMSLHRLMEFLVPNSNSCLLRF